MGITYQTNNRQRRKVMTAPLNAPPADLAATEVPSLADLPAGPQPASRPGWAWFAMAVAGAAVAAGALHFLL